MMNTSTETMMGIPSPPFLMIAPSGAPMKKKMMHESASVNLLMDSILNYLSTLSPSEVTMLRNSRSLICCCTLFSARFTALCRVSIGAFW